MGQGGPSGRKANPTSPAHRVPGGVPVAFRSSPDDKERIRQAIDIVDLVGSYTSLRRQGRNYVALCPWHDDSRPSLQVNPERQSFKCWVCDIGGDIFSFIMKMENVEFPEAVAMLAERAGIQLTPFNPRQGGSTSKSSSGAPGGNSFSGESQTSSPAAADSRTINASSIVPPPGPSSCFTNACSNPPKPSRPGNISASAAFRTIAFAAFTWAIRRIPGTGSSSNRCEPKHSRTVCSNGSVCWAASKSAAGITTVSRAGCCFRFATCRGGPSELAVGFCPSWPRRIRPSTSTRPSRRCSRRAICSTGSTWLAMRFILKTRTAVVTEGYTDCIIARQYGFENVLAVLGTALGERHIRLLKRFADRVVLVSGRRRSGPEAYHRRNSVAVLSRAGRFARGHLARRARPRAIFF